jgi:uncharacterized membrane protein YfcA
MLIQLLLGFAIGLALGLLGGGGSILTVPVLVYVIGQDPRTAVTASLAIVGANSVSGVMMHRSQGTLNWRVALLFGGAGMLMAFFAARLSKSFSPVALLLAFAVLMLVVGSVMLLQKKTADHAGVSRGPLVILAAGAGVGLLTGFLGVGGGFLIVPALVLLVGLPMRQAVGTSLLVIAMNSASGLLGHWGDAINLSVVAVFAASGITGAFIGARLSGRIQADRLRQLFAVFVLTLGCYLLFDNFGKLFN